MLIDSNKALRDSKKPSGGRQSSGKIIKAVILVLFVVIFVVILVLSLGRGYSSYGSGYLSYAKVGQCGCVVAGSGTTV